MIAYSLCDYKSNLPAKTAQLQKPERAKSHRAGFIKHTDGLKRRFIYFINI
jgi:hypothetical protein